MNSSLNPLRPKWLQHYNYQVVFTQSVFDPENLALRQTLPEPSAKILFFVDAGLNQSWPKLSTDIRVYCEAHSLECLNVVEVPGGEDCKTWPVLEQHLKTLTSHKVDRHSYVGIIGGGAVNDSVGLAAQLFHRGVRVVRIPTTVLAQNDAAVGVKTAINFSGTKNLIGAFSTPWAVINDQQFLTSLTDSQFMSGHAEATKVSLIKDAPFFAWLESHATRLRQRDPHCTQQAIYHGARLHVEHISQGGDAFESGNSRPLDFGHWAAHKLESLSGHQLSHGEAVSLGMALDSTYSFLTSLLSLEELDRILSLLQSLGLSTYHELLSDPQIFEGLNEFQEHLGGELCIALLSGIGRLHEAHSIDQKVMAEAAAYLQNHSKNQSPHGFGLSL